MGQTNPLSRFKKLILVRRLQIHILDLILKTADAGTEAGKRERSVAQILLLKVFYDQTDTGILSFLVRLIKAYDSTKQPKA